MSSTSKTKGLTAGEMIRDLLHVVDDSGLDTEIELHIDKRVFIPVFQDETGGFVIKEKN